MRPPVVCLLLAALLAWPAAASAETLDLREPVVMRGAAVAETPQGLVGSTATFTITVAENGSGHVFLDTFPLTQVDMQGSARLAARVAAQVTGKDLSKHDVFFVIRSGSVQIGGPSAGATLAVGTIAALMGWAVRPDVMMTGTVTPDGSVGPVGGVPEKAKAAADAGMKRFLFPAGEELVPLSSRPGAIVNVSEYCRDELRIECVPVNDVYEAVASMTDHAFVRPPVTGNVTGEAFRQRLAPLSQDLIREAEAMAAEAEARVAGVPAGAARDSLEEELAQARGTLARAQSAYANGTYYTAASLSFQASIAAHDVRDRARVAASRDAPAAAREVLDETRRLLGEVRAQVESAGVADTAAFESVGAAQVRLLEAEERFVMAEELVEGGTGALLAQAVYESAYAAERAETARWWLELGREAPAGAPVPREGLEELARDAITTSTEEIAYVEAVFGAGGAGGALDQPRALLAEAERAMERGFLAAALMRALEAQVRASDTLLLASFAGRVPEAKLDAARDAAGRAIQAARERGVEPLLAESQYEFALSLDDPATRLSFLGYARVLANIAGLPGLFGQAHGAVQTRFQGVPDQVGVEPAWMPVLFAGGLAVGLGLGLAAMLPPERRRGRRDAVPDEREWPEP